MKLIWKLVQNVTLISSLLYSTVAYSDLQVYGGEWPNDPGNLETNELEKDYLSGRSMMELDSEPVENFQFKNKRTFTSEYDRNYVRLGINFPELSTDNIKNASVSPWAGATLSTNESIRNDPGFEFAYGYAWRFIRLDFEYLNTRDLEYNVNPLFIGRAEQIKSTVMNQTFLVNIFLDTDQILYFKPYVSLSFGAVWNKVESSMIGGSGDGKLRSQSKLGAAWGIGAGFRARILDSWMAYLGYRYLWLGAPSWTDNTQRLKLDSGLSHQGINLGVIYLL